METVINAKTGLYMAPAIKTDGTVWTWRKNTSGQLEFESDSEKLIDTKPIPIFNLNSEAVINNNNGNNTNTIPILEDTNKNNESIINSAKNFKKLMFF